jgi:3-oxoacyl-[acyl-carrier protein] reductase
MKTCIITGAGSGIGRAAAIEVGRANEFEYMVLIGRTKEKLEETKGLMATDATVELLSYDLSDLDGIPALIEQVFQTTGEINCLMNIAGYTEPQPLLTTSIDNMCLTYQVNVFAPFVLIRECVKYMRLNTGISKILNVASTAGITPRPGWLSYASSKAAVVSMSQTLTDELAEYGIRVYCISPGRCATALRRKLAPNEDQSKIMQPEEVGHIICRLVAGAEQCLDGQNIIIRKKT